MPGVAPGNSSASISRLVSRTVDVRLSAKSLRGPSEWLRDYERFGTGAIDRLVVYAAKGSGGPCAQAQEKIPVNSSD